jgi:putative PIN family toxin of toxin-antitoxin system
MKKRHSAKTIVVIDTSVWVGFLIGKRLRSLNSILFSNSVELAISDELISEVEFSLPKT